MLNGRAFETLSEFYTDMWHFLNAFFDDARWAEVTPVSETPSERFALLRDSFEHLHREEFDGALAKQIVYDFQEVMQLQQDFDDKHPQPGAEWFSRAEKMRTYSQELGLRYAEMSVADV